MSGLHLDHVCFDIDGTLCDYGIDPQVALTRVCESLGVEATLDPGDYYELYKAVAVERPGDTYRAISDEAYRRLLEMHGYSDARLAERVGEAYRDVRLSSLSLYPETLEVLESLNGRYSLGIISNGPSEIQRAKLRKFRLARYFDSIIISGEVGVEKPSETIFALALGEAQAKAERSAHVGDSLRHDVKGALGAGLTSFWVNRGVLDLEITHVAPHYELQSLAELLPILDG